MVKKTMCLFLGKKTLGISEVLGDKGSIVEGRASQAGGL
jgi:hypothetical protein